MDVLANLEPKRVMHYFEALSRIPRESKHEEAVSAYLKETGESLGLETYQDAAGNVCIRKPGSIGKEHLDPVILQGHMDMVCVKEDDKQFDFATEPLQLRVDGDFIRAEGTTLGADNGIAVAMALALLEEEGAEHPPLEVLITTDEETGMGGASNLDGAWFRGKTLINLDSEEEGEFTVSCAGGLRVSYLLPFSQTENPFGDTIELVIEGLSGGHSGIEIHKGRANAIKLLGRVLAALSDVSAIVSVSGGEKDNAIAKQARAVLSTDRDLNERILACETAFREEYRISDPDIRIVVRPVNRADLVLETKDARRLIDTLLLMPQGVQTWSMDIEGLVESSTNIGVMKMSRDAVILNNAVRSSLPSRKQEIVDKFEALGRIMGAEILRQADYPAWSYEPVSPIRDLMAQVYEETTGKKPVINAIHAGLETGILAERIGKLDMISIGPEMHDVHTPREHLSISSTQRTYAFLKEVLGRME